jgi:hypothetical protein
MKPIESVPMQSRMVTAWIGPDRMNPTKRDNTSRAGFMPYLPVFAGLGWCLSEIGVNSSRLFGQ